MRVLRAIPWDPLGSRFVGSGGGLEHRKKRVQRDGARAECRILRCPGGPRGPVSYAAQRAFKKGCHSAAVFAEALGTRVLRCAEGPLEHAFYGAWEAL